MAKCLFQRKITTMMLNDVNVNDIHFWNNKYDHPEEYLCTNKIRVIYFYSNKVNFLPKKSYVFYFGGATVPCPPQPVRL